MPVTAALSRFNADPENEVGLSDDKHGWRRRKWLLFRVSRYSASSNDQQSSRCASAAP